MTISQIILLFLASIVGGTLNAVAGGGSFVTLPSLIFAGVLPINANATSTVALWPGAIASIGAYRKELLLQKRTQVLLLSSTSLVGGVLGAFLLLSTSQSTFIRLLPYLLLVATMLFAVSGPLTARMRERSADKRAALLKERVAGEVVEQVKTTEVSPSNAIQSRTSWLKLSGIAVLQFVIAIYGGYFGGGIGILMLATLGLMGMENIHEMNAMKTLLAACINGVAVVIFVVKGVVVWPQAILMVVGAIIGGFGGAYFARKLHPLWVRWFVIAVGVGMTIYFFAFS